MAEQNQNQQSGNITLPAGVMQALMIALLSGGVGAVGGRATATPDEQPAVLAQAIQRVGEDVAELKVDVRAMDKAQAADRELAAAAAADRWTRTMHEAYARDVESRLKRVETFVTREEAKRDAAK